MGMDETRHVSLALHDDSCSQFAPPIIDSRNQLPGRVRLYKLRVDLTQLRARERLRNEVSEQARWRTNARSFAPEMRVCSGRCSSSHAATAGDRPREGTTAPRERMHV